MPNQAIAESRLGRDGIFLTTKVPGCGLQGISITECYAGTKKLHAENLKSLNLPYSDLLLVHFPPIDGCELGCKGIQEQWTAMEEMLADNLTRAIGSSTLLLT